MKKIEQIKASCTKFWLSALSTSFDQLIVEAEQNQLSNLDLVVKNLMESEMSHRRQKDLERWTKRARLPMQYSLALYDHSFENGLGKKQLNQLRELKWLGQNFNIVLLGLSGTGKTCRAVFWYHKEYLACFKTVEDPVKVLKMKDVTRTAVAEYNRIRKVYLLDRILYNVES